MSVRKGRALRPHSRARPGSKSSDMLRRTGVAAPGQNERLCEVSGSPTSCVVSPLPIQHLSQVSCNCVRSDQTQCDRTSQFLGFLWCCRERGEEPPQVPGITKTVKAHYSLSSLINVKTDTAWTGSCQGH